jgi:peptidoglycan/xylan/chitin deacetylase (PgdA/CDA1 family)
MKRGMDTGRSAAVNAQINLLFRRAAFLVWIGASSAPGQQASSPAIPDYGSLRNSIVRELEKVPPGAFGERVRGVKTRFRTGRKLLALTLDACGGKTGGGVNLDLIRFLSKERIPATLFVSGRWIDANRKTFNALAADSLFEIENHGLFHRVCSVTGRTMYGLPSTRNASDVVDEVELNARKIHSLTGRRPVFFRPPAAVIDEASAAIAEKLGLGVVGYSILPGDAAPFAPADSLRNRLVRGAEPGGIILMHFNHPEWNEKRALETAVPILRGRGYSFVRLKDLELE